MHADEYRDYQQIRELRIAETLSDPEHVYNKLESLSGPGKDAYVRRLETERDDLKLRVRSAHATLDELKSENALLASEKELAERRLNSVRESRTFQVGKLAVTPVQAARKVVTNPKSSFRQLSSSLKSSLLSARTKLIEEKNQIQAKSKEPSEKGGELNTQQPSADEARGYDKHSAVQELKVATAENEVPPEHSTASDSTVHRNPLEQFQKKQSVRNFERALNFLWFTEGKIAETQSLINKYPKFVEKLSEVPKSLASRVLGEVRLLELDLVPLRSQFPAYVAEPKRVMYCIHQSPLYNSNGYSTRSRGWSE